ncbi:MAG: hypothetical protein P8102_13940, partial [Gammaproteobacteria bacterium]
MHALATLRPFRTMAAISAALVLAACGQGNGPDSIAGTPAPPPSSDACDSINFESECPQPDIVNFNGGATIVVDNPDASGINTSDRVARMQKFPDEVFGGTLLNLGEPIDFSEGESYRVKVWSPRPVTVSFKLEEQGNSEGGLTKEQPHPGGSAWEELCFDFTGQNVPPPVVALTIIFDNGTLGQADTDPENWTFYYDDITQVESCATGPGASIIPDAGLYVSEGDPDLVIPEDYAERTGFGSGSVIDPLYADDEAYSPVLSIFSGTDYGANIAQVGFIGFRAGFLRRYETVDFKVKGMPGQVVFVKLFDGVSSARVSLTSSAYATELGDGWFQVSIPLAVLGGAAEATGLVLESDDSSAEQFRMLLTDIGFSGTGDFVPADPGIIPDITLFDRDGTPDLVPGADYDDISAFDSGADIQPFTSDLDFSPALSVTTGFGYGIWNAQFAYLGFTPGFATAYETLQFKVKDLSGDVIRVKLLPDPAYVDVNVTSSPYATELGNGWYQVSIPIADIPGAGVSEGLLFETISPPPEASFTYLITDIGFSGEVSGPTPVSVDFEGDPSAFDFGPDGGFGGGVSTVIENPVPGGINTSGQVVQMQKFAVADFGGSTLALPEGVDWSLGETFRMKVWSQREVPVLFKLEGDPAKERPARHSGGSEWQDLCFDFTGDTAGEPVTGISIFFDLGVVGDAENDPDNWTFYYDDIEQSSEGCPVDVPLGPVDFEPEGLGQAFAWTVFENADNPPIMVIANPDASGANTSANVAEFTARAGGQPFAGAVTLDLPTFTLDASNSCVKIKVWKPVVSDVGIKFETGTAASTGEIRVANTVTSQWEELSFDFSVKIGEPESTDIAGFVLFPDFATRTEDNIVYFDDIRFLGSAECSDAADHGPGTAGVFTETATETTIAITSITNSIDFTGNNTVADPNSTAIPAFEGDVVLSIDYQDTGAFFGGAVLNFGGVDLTAYDTLNFTVDTSGIAGFADLTIQIEPPVAGA